jgi:hypothetical protein
MSRGKCYGAVFTAVRLAPSLLSGGNRTFFGWVDATIVACSTPIVICQGAVPRRVVPP